METTTPTAPTIPAFLLRREPEPRYMVTDDLSLVITAGERSITLIPQDLRRLQAFLFRFEKEPESC
jgi:hypothetical protein